MLLSLSHSQMSLTMRLPALRRLLQLQSRLLPLSSAGVSRSSSVIGVQQAHGFSSANSIVSDTSHGSEHTAKWMTNYEIKSPQELIAQVPPIEVKARFVACEGSGDPALGHPVEYICLDLEEAATCKYCGLRYVQAHGHHHH